MTRRGGKWLLAAAFVLLCGLAAREIARKAEGPGASSLDRVALFRADPALLARLRAEGPEGARSLFHALLRRYGESPPAGVTECFWKDSSEQTTGETLGELADARLTKEMIAAARRKDLSYALRLVLVVALCRPSHREALGPLVDILLDRREDDRLKKKILYRLPRFRANPPRRLRDLLYLPFGELDIAAAGTLSRMGDPEAPSLVLWELKRALAAGEWDTYHWHLDYHLAKAACAIAGAKAPPPASGDVDFRYYRAMIEAPAKDLEAWMKKHPKWKQTDYERTRLAYLGSDRRAKELSLHSLKDVLDSGGDFDLASASLLLIHDESVRPKLLERLFLLSRYVKRKLAGVSDPLRQIAILDAILLDPAAPNDEVAVHNGFDSFLPGVLEGDQGNCLGLTTLFLAVAERDGLPLHGVLLPNHALVRYQAGRFRRNIETTEGGRICTDESYRGPGLPATALRNRSKSEILSAICSNASAACLRAGAPGQARKSAETALALDPQDADAYVNRAVASRYSTPAAGAGAVLSDLETAVQLESWRTPLRRNLAQARLDLLSPEKALPDLEGFPDLKAVCLARLGHFRQAETLLTSDSPLEARLEVKLRKNPKEALSIVHGMRKAGQSSLDLYLTAARVLAKISPAAALDGLRLLDEIRGQATTLPPAVTRTPQGLVVRDLGGPRGRKAGYFLVRAYVAHAGGLPEAAAKAFRKVDRYYAQFDLLLEVRRELGSK